ncbi:MAG: SpvB/TcaC N-terminal domain-containing protein [Pseudomonadota bacterium]
MKSNKKKYICLFLAYLLLLPEFAIAEEIRITIPNFPENEAERQIQTTTPSTPEGMGSIPGKGIESIDKMTDQGILRLKGGAEPGDKVVLESGKDKTLGAENEEFKPSSLPDSKKSDEKTADESQKGEEELGTKSLALSANEGNMSSKLPNINNPSFKGPSLAPLTVSNEGILNTAFQIETPAGVLGQTPQISLTYGSNRGASCIWAGWTYSPPIIARDTTYGPPKYIDPGDKGAGHNYMDADRFISPTGFLKFIKEDKGGYVYRSEVESNFTRYVYHKSENYWLVQYTDGNIAIIGDDSGNGNKGTINYIKNGKIDKGFKWHLTRMYDNYGNIIDYEYYGGRTGADSHEELVTKRIIYGGWQLFGEPSGGKPGIYEIVFSYKPEDSPDMFGRVRTDYRSSYVSKNKIVFNNKLLKVISVYFTGTGKKELIREYRLIHRLNEQTNVSMLSKIETYGIDGKTKQPDITFKYNDEVTTSPGNQFTKETTFGANLQNLTHLALSGVIKSSLSNHHDGFFADLDNDGYIDIVLAEPPTPKSNFPDIYLYRNTGKDWSSSPVRLGLNIANTDTIAPNFELRSKDFNKFYPADLNGDGIVDLAYDWDDLVKHKGKNYPGIENFVRFFINTGNSGFKKFIKNNSKPVSNEDFAWFKYGSMTK